MKQLAYTVNYTQCVVCCGVVCRVFCGVVSCVVCCVFRGLSLVAQQHFENQRYFDVPDEIALLLLVNRTEHTYIQTYNITTTHFKKIRYKKIK